MNARGDHKGPCLSHRRYHLTCEEFGVLLAAYADRCGICKIPGTETRLGYLLIDHDHDRGDWAVRGMLCSTCNRRIRDGRVPSPEAAAYLADPWYLRRLAERGISPDPMREPPMGTVIAGRRHYWRRTERGWVMASPNLRGGPMSWRALNQLLAPYNIRIQCAGVVRLTERGGHPGEVTCAAPVPVASRSVVAADYEQMALVESAHFFAI